MINKVATAVFVKDNKVLLEKRKETEDNYAGLWSFPGGHIEREEKPEDTLVREMKEELDVEITDYEFKEVFKDIDPTSKEPYEHNIFICRKWKGDIKYTKEEERIKWVDIYKIPEMEKVSRTAMRVFEILGR